MIPLAGIQEKLVTGEELLAMGDIGPSELIDGRVVFMSPTSKRHGSLENRIAHRLNQFVYPHSLGEVLVGEVGIYIHRNPDRIRAADVIFVSRDKYNQDSESGYLGIAPELVVEIVSPTDRWDEIRQKIRDYFSIGGERVWVCEPEQQDILVYRAPDTYERFSLNEAVPAEGILQGFQLPVAEIFAD